MGMILAPTLIDWGRIDALLGCGRPDVADRVVQDCRAKLDDLNQWRAGFDDSGRDAFQLTRDLLLQPEPLAGANTWPESERALCLHILKLWVDHLGQSLSCDTWWAFRYSWFATVDEALEAAGSRSRASWLGACEPPGDWPWSDDFPLLTVWDPTAASRWLEGYAAPAAERRDEREAAEEIARWMRAAVDSNLSLMVFCAG